MGQTDLTCRTFLELEVDSSLTLHVASSLLRTLYTHHFVWQHRQLALKPGFSKNLSLPTASAVLFFGLSVFDLP